MSRSILTAAVFVLGVGSVASMADAQQPLGRYQPIRQYPSIRRPTISPYLDYCRTPLGPLDNYHELVRPKLQLRDALIEQERQLSIQQQNLRRLGHQVAQPQRSSGAPPTGIGAGFGNFLHFYPANQ